jgi:hypothetical protein
VLKILSGAPEANNNVECDPSELECTNDFFGQLVLVQLSFGPVVFGQPVVVKSSLGRFVVHS